jgi:hypothetical protein
MPRWLFFVEMCETLIGVARGCIVSAFLIRPPILQTVRSAQATARNLSDDLS